MKKLNEEIMSKIIGFLEEKLATDKNGASVYEISKKTGHNRLTVSKYLEIMKAQGLVESKTIAQAKIYTLPTSEKKPTILIVDDEPHIVDLIRLALDKEKYSTQEAYSGIDALEKIFTSLPDLIILDLMMPGVDGFQVIERLRKNKVTQNIPIIILSAKTKHEDKMEGLEIGADEYITKPFDPGELESQVKQLLSDNSPNIVKNPVSGLPAKKPLVKEINKRLSQSIKFDMVILKITNLQTINAKFTHKTGQDILNTFGNFLNLKFDSDYISHIGLETFVVLTTRNPANFRALHKEYGKFIPFIYSEKDLTNISKENYIPEIEQERINYRDLLDRRGRLEHVFN